MAIAIGTRIAISTSIAPQQQRGRRASVAHRSASRIVVERAPGSSSSAGQRDAGHASRRTRATAASPRIVVVSPAIACMPIVPATVAATRATP